MKPAAAVAPILPMPTLGMRDDLMLARRLPRRTALTICLAAGLAVAGHASARNFWHVSDCSDDGGIFTLRVAMNNAIDGDEVYIDGQCSLITLTNGEIVTHANNLLIDSFGDPTPVIDAGYASRVIHHTGTGTIELDLVTLQHGKYLAPDSLNPGGGCIYSSGTVYLKDSTLQSCAVSANEGPAIGGALSATSAIVRGSAVVNSSAYSADSFALGGGVNAVNVVLQGAYLAGNSVRGYGIARGGAVSANGSTYDLAIYSSFISGNRAVAMSSNASSYATGGAVSSATPIVLLDSGITGNSVSAAAGTAIGGGAFGHGLTMARSTISGNHIEAAGSSGGGAYIKGDTFITYSTIDHNRSFNNAGLVLGGNAAASAVIWNTTISSNVAEASSAMFVSIPLILSNSTIAFNSAAGTSAGLYLYPGGTTDLHSVLIANNGSTSGGGFDLVARAGIQGDHNLIRNPASDVPPDTIVGTNPELGPLANYGGPTRTHGILHTSVAIDAGSNDTPGLDNDQRGDGFPRVFGNAADIGAWEWQGGPDDPVFGGNFDPGGG